MNSIWRRFGFYFYFAGVCPVLWPDRSGEPRADL